MALARWGAALQRRWQAIDPAERAGFVAGARFYVGSLPPVFAWGLVTGVAMSKSVLTIPQAIGMTLLVYAGSSQLAVLPLMAAGLPVWTVLLTAFIVNVRFIIFSAGLMQHFSHLPFGRRVLIGFFNGDLPFVLFSQRYRGRARSAARKAISGAWRWPTGRSGRCRLSWASSARACSRMHGAWRWRARWR